MKKIVINGGKPLFGEISISVPAGYTFYIMKKKEQ